MKRQPGRTFASLKIIGLFLFSLSFLLSGIVFSSIRWLQRDLPPSSALEEYRPPLVTKVYAGTGELLAEFYIQRRASITLDEIPKCLVDATLTMEDRGFYRHWGVNIFSIARAFFQNIRAGRVVRGASTITQQLARNLFLTQERSLVRKLKEALLALEIERRYSKDEILSMYLNQIYYGCGAYGVEAAAKTYFGKSASELALPECALLVGLARSPLAYSPTEHPEASLGRRRVVLNAMTETGVISEEEAQPAKSAPLKLNGHKSAENEAPYFVEEVRRKVEAEFGSGLLYRDGVTIHTTLNLDLQRAANKAVEETLSQLEKQYNFRTKRDTIGSLPDSVRRTRTEYIQGALVSLDPHTGEIKAMVGGRDFSESEFNRATQAMRQPGSSFKPFVFTAAIDNGFTPADIVIDAPIVVQIGDSLYSPANYDRTFLGPVTLRRGLALSRNLVAIRLLRAIGIRTAVEYARKMGIESRLANVLSLALGSCGVRLVELTSAFGTLANEGMRVEPLLIEKILDRDGKVIYENKRVQRRVLSPQTAYVVTNMMESVLNEGTAIAARTMGFHHPAAGKTGTTDDYTDAWFIGFTPDLVCGVWVGFDQLKRIARRATGAQFALPIWVDFMKEAVKDYPPRGFEPPSGIVTAKVCQKTGLLATPLCPTVRTEIFIEGTAPEDTCYPHGKESIPLEEYNFEQMDRKSMESKDIIP